MCHKDGIIKFHQENVLGCLSSESLLCPFSAESQRAPGRWAPRPGSGMRQHLQAPASPTCHAHLINTRRGLLKLIMAAHQERLPLEGDPISFQVKNPLGRPASSHLQCIRRSLKKKKKDHFLLKRPSGTSFSRGQLFLHSKVSC